MRVLVFFVSLMVLGLSWAYPVDEIPIESFNPNGNTEELFVVSSDQGHENESGRYARQHFGGGFPGGYGGYDHGGYGNGGYGHGGFDGYGGHGGHGGFDNYGGHGGFGHGGF